MGIQTIYVRRGDDPEEAALLARLRHQGFTRLSGLVIERVYRLEGEFDPAALRPLFVNPVFETDAAASGLDPAHGPIVEIGYRRAVTDPETPSILSGAWALGQDGLVWARLALRYQFGGVDDRPRREAIAARVSTTRSCRRSSPPGHVFASLRPTGEPDPVRGSPLAGFRRRTAPGLAGTIPGTRRSRRCEPSRSTRRELGRPLTDAEIEICVQSWSDHCYHTTWKSLGLLQDADGGDREDRPSRRGLGLQATTPAAWP